MLYRFWPFVLFCELPVNVLCQSFYCRIHVFHTEIYVVRTLKLCHTMYGKVPPHFVFSRLQREERTNLKGSTVKSLRKIQGIPIM